MAVQSGRIVAVGSNDDMRPYRGPSTEVISVRSRMLLPAFQDAHVHAVGGGFERLRCDLSGERTRDAYLRVVRDFAASHPDVDWILGGGWSMDAFPGGIPSKEDLDAAVPDRPVFLPNRDHHGAWVNSAALARARITRETSDPPDGRIERARHGEPAGTLQEAAMDLVARLIPPPTLAEVEAAILEAQRYLHSLGIAAWQEAIVGTYAGIPDSFEAYRRLDGRGRLTARVVGALWWDRDRDEDQIDAFLERRARSTPRFQATSIKIMLDGVCENFTASMLEPYQALPSGARHPRGTSYVDPESLKRIVTRLDREGFQVHMHAIGDRAVRSGLDAVEAARRANPPGDRRHHLAHLQVVHPRDIPRFPALNAIANAQPLWACRDAQMTELTVPFLGPERSGWQYPFASLRAAGARLAFGSDWPVSSPNPLLGVQVAVTRSPTEEHSGVVDRSPLHPEQRLELRDALTAYTRESAFVNHLEAVSGSIQSGREADLVLLDRDPFAGPPEEIGQARVLLTLCGGKPVHRAGDL